MQPDEPIHDDAFFDELLAPSRECGNGKLREALLNRTTRRIRLQHRLRHVRMAGLFSLVFVGGMAAATALFGPRQAERLVVVHVPVEVEKPSPAPAAPAQRLSPAEIELQAERTLARNESSRLFREAGDRYLREEANLEAALRCYRNFLDEADEVNMALTDTDTWLLTSLKNDRRKETENDP